MILDKSEPTQAATSFGDGRARPDGAEALSSSPRGGHWPAAVARLFASLDGREISIVRGQRASATRAHLVPVAAALTRLGNGWIYPVIIMALWLSDGWSAGRATLQGGAAVLIAHALYPLCKRTVARQRPCIRYADLPTGPPPLDYYAFPSGHCMTACAACLPVAVVHPVAGVGLGVLVGALGWSRVVLGHHYPSDIIGGALLGAAAGAFVLALPW